MSLLSTTAAGYPPTPAAFARCPRCGWFYIADDPDDARAAADVHAIAHRVRDKGRR